MSAAPPEPEDFELALELMRQRGWHQGSSIGPGGSICAARALNLATQRRVGKWADWVEVRKVLSPMIPGLDSSLNPNANITRWNDAVSTQWRDVERVFTAAAARLRGFASGDPRDDT